MRIVVLTVLFALVGGAIAPAAALTEARVARPEWRHDTTFEFGIYEGGQRKATAYYRILREDTADGPGYRFKYSGKNDLISEASEVLVDAATMLPFRSNRKVVYNQRTFFQDVTYTGAQVLIRKRHEGESVREYELPASAELYDYEELIWLVPLLDFGGDSQTRFELFNTINELTTTVIVSRREDETLDIQGQSFPARVFSFDVGLTKYKYWLVMQDGLPVPGRVDMGSTSFVNLKLRTDRVTPFSDPVAAPRYDEPADEFGSPDEQAGSYDDGAADGGEDGGGGPFDPPPALPEG